MYYVFCEIDNAQFNPCYRCCSSVFTEVHNITPVTPVGSYYAGSKFSFKVYLCIAHKLVSLRLTTFVTGLLINQIIFLN